MTDQPRWAVLDADGYVVSTYRREASARLNAGGADVQNMPDGVKDPLAMRYSAATGRWHTLKAPRPVGPVKAAGYRERRRQAYARALEGDLQFEAIVEALIGLATPAARAVSPGAFDKLDALAAKIAAVKAANPKS